MKQLKALEILKFMKMSSSSNITILNEAIAELEALENRSCENCKSFQFWSESKDISNWDSHWVDLGLCYNRVQSGCFNSTVDKDFCCNKWESK